MGVDVGTGVFVGSGVSVGGSTVGLGSGVAVGVDVGTGVSVGSGVAAVVQAAVKKASRLRVKARNLDMRVSSMFGEGGC